MDAVDAVDGVDMVDAVAAVVRVLWPLNNNYSIPYTAVQQYSSTAVQQRQQYSSLSHHTRRAVVGGLIRVASALEHANLCGQCSTWSMLICVASGGFGVLRRQNLHLASATAPLSQSSAPMLAKRSKWTMKSPILP